jgi:hypothetical protein
MAMRTVPALRRIHEVDGRLGNQRVPHQHPVVHHLDQSCPDQPLHRNRADRIRAHRPSGQRQQAERGPILLLQPVEPGTDREPQRCRWNVVRGEFGEQQRIPSGPPEQGRFVDRGQVGPHRPDHRAGRVGGQRFDGDDPAAGLHQRRDGLVRRRFTRPHGGQEPDPADQQGNHIEGCRVCPLQVLEDQQPGTDRVEHLSGPSGCVGALEVSTQSPAQAEMFHPRQGRQRTAGQDRPAVPLGDFLGHAGLADPGLTGEHHRVVLLERNPDGVDELVTASEHGVIIYPTGPSARVTPGSRRSGQE